jgi:pyruvate/2-oxoacid:ferredoxin oxidoreductase beta subunit
MVELGIPGTKTFWAGEDNFFLPGGIQCRGCGSLLAAKLILRTIYETDRNAMVFGRTCGGGRSELQTGGRIGCDGSGMMGIITGLELRGVKGKNLVVMSGDGRTLEMGFGDFVAAFDREEPITWIILDNQAYASSGSNITPTTPLHAATRIFTPAMHGKLTPERNVPLMMIFAKARYVATGTAAYVRDLVFKVQQALRTKPSYVHVVAPCVTSWRYSPDKGVQLSRLLVQTGLLPLWQYKEGVLRRTVRVPPETRVPLAEYLRLQERYAHLSEKDINEIEAYIERQNKLIDALEQSLTIPKVTVSY